MTLRSVSPGVVLKPRSYASVSISLEFYQLYNLFIQTYLAAERNFYLASNQGSTVLCVVQMDRRFCCHSRDYTRYKQSNAVGINLNVGWYIACGYHSVRYTGVIHKSEQTLDDFLRQLNILPSTHFSATKTAPAQAVATGVTVTVFCAQNATYSLFYY